MTLLTLEEFKEWAEEYPELADFIHEEDYFLELDNIKFD